MSSIVLYTDCNLGKHIFPGELRAAGLHVECHFDHFPGDAPDEAWIPHVAQLGWYALTNDRRIYRNKLQRELVLRSGLGLFVLPAGHVVIKDLADNFVLTFPKVERFVARQSGAFIAESEYVPIRVETWRSFEDLTDFAFESTESVIRLSKELNEAHGSLQSPAIPEKALDFLSAETLSATTTLRGCVELAERLIDGNLDLDEFRRAALQIKQVKRDADREAGSQIDVADIYRAAPDEPELGAK